MPRMKSVLLSVLGAAICAAAAGYGLLEAISDPVAVTREMGGVTVEIELERRLYEVPPVVAAMAATGLVAATLAFTLARFTAGRRSRRRR